MDGRVRQVLDAAVAEGYLTPAAAHEGPEHSAGFLGCGPEAAASPGRDDEAVDLGTGGGLPGLLLAAQTDCHWHLVDRGARRCRFLEWAVRLLELADRVAVIEADAAEVGRGPLRGTVALVTARGFAPPGPTAECAAPLLRPGGLLVVSEPPDDAGVRWPADGVGALGLAPAARWHSGTAGYQALRAVGPCADRFPRRFARQQAAPLF